MKLMDYKSLSSPATTNITTTTHTSSVYFPIIIKNNSNFNSTPQKTKVHFQQAQKEQNCAMTNEETRSLTGVVAKTRALFENSNKTTIFSTPQHQKTFHSKIQIKQSLSANNVNITPKFSTSCIEHDSDKENKSKITPKSRLESQSCTDSSLVKPSSFLKLKKFHSPSTQSIPNESTNNSNNNSNNTPLKKSMSSSRMCSPKELFNKSEEISKELNIPLSVKQAKACFENLALSSQNTVVKLPVSKSLKFPKHPVPELTSSTESSSTSLSGFNSSSSTSSSCETTPRSNEKKIKEPLISSISSTSSCCSIESNKYLQVNCFRKLEDIINEADSKLKCQTKPVEEKKLKSILRKTASPEMTVRSSSCSSSSCSPSSSLSSISTTKPQEETTLKVDNTSCVLPSKLKLKQTTDEPPASPFSKTSSLSNSFNKNTPVRNVGSYIKNQTNTSISSSNSGLVKRVTRNATNAREALIRWCRKMTEEYDNVSISNFSSSWSDGLAFCALIHHFMPNEFDYSRLHESNPRYNFELAFKIAEEKAGIVSLLDVDDMIEMGNSPDWKCVFTYVHSIYQRFKENV